LDGEEELCSKPKSSVLSILLMLTSLFLLWESLEDQILQANPVLEPLANAKKIDHVKAVPPIL